MSPRADPTRIRAEFNRIMGPTSSDGVFATIVRCICDEFNRVLDEYDKDPENPQLLEAASVHLMVRYEAALAAQALED